MCVCVQLLCAACGQSPSVWEVCGAHQDQELGSAVPHGPVSKAGVSKHVGCGVICLQRSFLLQLTKL